MAKNTIVYFLGNTMYLNITNLCTNKCVFCIRNLSDTVGESNLWLEAENITAAEVIEEIKKNAPEVRDEFVFCGYGEPLIKIEVVKEVAKFLKENFPEKVVRVNSNGHANLIHKRNVVPELKGLIDKISISLNAENPELYGELTCCKFDNYVAYEAVKNFITECKNAGIETTASIVVGYKNYKIDVEKCKEISQNLGVTLKVREWLDEGYK